VSPGHSPAGVEPRSAADRRQGSGRACDGPAGERSAGGPVSEWSASEKDRSPRHRDGCSPAAPGRLFPGGTGTAARRRHRDIRRLRSGATRVRRPGRP